MSVDPFAALKNEVFRPFAAVVMPGAIAVAPFAILSCNLIKPISDFYAAKPIWFFALVAGAATTAGLLIENIGSSIERGIDRCMEVEYLKGNDDVWTAYLDTTGDKVGHRVISATVTRLKFLNSLMPAAFFFTVGIVLLQAQVQPWTWHGVRLWCLGTFFFLVWVFRTSTELSEVLSTTRYYLIDQKKRPVAYNPDAETPRRYRHFAYVVGELLTSKVYAIDLKDRWALAVIPVILEILLPKPLTKFFKRSPSER